MDAAPSVTYASARNPVAAIKTAILLTIEERSDNPGRSGQRSRASARVEVNSSLTTEQFTKALKYTGTGIQLTPATPNWCWEQSLSRSLDSKRSSRRIPRGKNDPHYCVPPAPRHSLTSPTTTCAKCETFDTVLRRCRTTGTPRRATWQICGAIASGGGAEQYNADKKYAEAVADAVEECADDTEGQTCLFVWRMARRRASCVGARAAGQSGFAHVSCLARQAKILVEEAEERDLLGDAFDARWARWHMWSVRATVPRRREMRARVGVLEDLRGAAGGGRYSVYGNKPAWERFVRWRLLRGLVVRERGRLGFEAAPWRQMTTFSSFRTTLQTRMQSLDTLRRP